jgi:hypothetical protein
LVGFGAGLVVVAEIGGHGQLQLSLNEKALENCILFRSESDIAKLNVDTWLTKPFKTPDPLTIAFPIEYRATVKFPEFADVAEDVSFILFTQFVPS